jgi:hypothetical protein
MTLIEAAKLEDLEARVRALELLFVERKGESKSQRQARYILDAIRQDPDAFRRKSPVILPVTKEKRKG